MLTAGLLISGFTAFAQDSGTVNLALNFDHGYVPSQGVEFTLNEGASFTLDNNKLNLTGAGDGAGIGPVGSFSEFALQFDVSGFAPGQSAWVGVAFGQPAQDSLFFQDSQLLAIFNDGVFVYDFTNNGNPYNVSASDIAEGWVGSPRTWAGGNDALFDDNEPGDEGFGDKVNTFKIVVKNNSVTLYRKNNIDAGADDRFTKIDGKWDNLTKTEGYVKICFTGSTTVAIDNIRFSSNPDADLSAITPVEETLAEGTGDAPVLEPSVNTLKASWTMSGSKYSVKLFDKDGKFITSKVTTEKSATFSDLSVGSYQVQVVAIDANGRSSAISKSALAELKADTSTTGEEPAQSTTAPSNGTTNPGNSTNPSNPKTSDSTTFASLALVIALSVLSALVLYGSKTKLQAK